MSHGRFEPKHGHWSGNRASPTWISWAAMRSRCENPKHPAFKNYGGRGIIVCERWRTFENFLADMGDRPKDKTLDRFPNRDGAYEPGNCRWATRTQQHNNERRNRVLTANGESLTATEWARRLGMKPDTLLKRLSSSGWSVERALSTPVRP